MSITTVQSPTSLVRFGVARADITPPVGIYHRMWGAARHDRSTGIHRPLYGDIMAFSPRDAARTILQVQLDMVGLVPDVRQEILAAIASATGVAETDIIISFSHTHAGGVFHPDRASMPGGELIAPYLAETTTKLADTARRAVDSLANATVTYRYGRCALAANRDYWDDANHRYTCGYNPAHPADDTLLLARITDAAGNLRATVVNYACHPTTLAWDNTLISPDYVGALREVVENATGAPCVFTLGACGDLGPRHGFVGDVAIADRNGRQVGYAALATLEAMDAPATDFQYDGPVVSGATLGVWSPAPLSENRSQAAATFAGGKRLVDLPKKPTPSEDELRARMEHHLAAQRAADERGDAIAARDEGAHAERARRWLLSLRDLPQGPTLPFEYTVFRFGDAFWVSVGGEPYNAIQQDVRRHFPNHPIVFTVLAGGLRAGYLLTAEHYGVGLYQEEPSITASGCLEQLTGAVAAQIAALV